MPAEEIKIHAVAEQLRSLGVREGDVLLVHTSFRAVRPVEGGPAGLIEALTLALGPSGTLVMPSWTGDDNAVFDPTATKAAPDLGIVADTFWRLPGIQRCPHPFAFAARGPEAERILADPLVLPPHQPASPVGRVHELDGQILLIGVDHDASTSLHLAEHMAGVPYGVRHHITLLENGAVRRMEYLEPDHCCKRFRLAGDWLSAGGLQRTGIVGHARSTLARSRDVVTVALAELTTETCIFLHPQGSGCEECQHAWESIV